jgi:hypothetical protein
MASRRARQRPGVGWGAELADDQRSASSGASSSEASELRGFRALNGAIGPDTAAAPETSNPPCGRAQ